MTIDAYARLDAMRDRGEIDDEQHALARKYLKEELAKLQAKAAVSDAQAENRRAWYKSPWRLGFAALLGYGTIHAVFVGTPAVEVRRADYGDRWPYARFDAAAIRCHNDRRTGRPFVTIEFDRSGVEYGLNGAAMGVGRYPDPRVFLERDEYGTISLQVPNDWLPRGLALCR